MTLSRLRDTAKLIAHRTLGEPTAARLSSRAYLLRTLLATRFFRPRDVSHTYGGVPLRLHLADPIARRWYDSDWQELPEVALLARGKLRPGATVFNLGAHQGIVALLLSRRVQPGGRVVAVEANGHNVTVARRNFMMNDGQNIDILHSAASDTPGTVKFNRFLNGRLDDGSGEFGSLTVTAVTVDRLATSYGVPDVLFIDVEGAEHRVLRGARETLHERPDCFVEVHVDCGLEKLGGSVSEILEFFRASDYRLFIASERQREFREFSTDSPLMADRFFLVALGRGPR